MPLVPENAGVRREWQVEVRSVVAAPPGEVWARVVTPEGINDEMRPWMTMALPRGSTVDSIDALVVGQPVGRAWLRLGGVVPFDFDDLVVVELEPGRRFREESSMLSMRRWIHDRTVEADGAGTVVLDQVTLAPRLPLRPIGPVLRVVVLAFFRHRHRRLARHFP